MKIDRDSSAYINCRTQEEQNMVLDMFEMLGLTWANHKAPREVIQYDVPSRFLIERYIYHGRGCINSHHTSKPVIEAKYLRNQWISMKKGIDKCQNV